MMPLRLLHGRFNKNDDEEDKRNWKPRPSWKSRPASDDGLGRMSGARRRLKYFSRVANMRRLRLALVLIVFVVAILYVVAPSRRGGSSGGTPTADSRHLDHFVRRFQSKAGESLQPREDPQAVLGSPEGEDFGEGEEGGEDPQEGDGVSYEDDEDYWDEDWETVDVDAEDAEGEDEDGEDVDGGDEDGEEVDEDEEEPLLNQPDEDEDDNTTAVKPYRGPYRQVFSHTTGDRRYFSIHFGGPNGFNPSIIPHPSKHDLWIVVAQHTEKIEQITCTAGFLNGILTCTEPPATVQTAPSVRGICEGEHSHYNMKPGARDARMFYGPGDPYLLYGSQSQWTCMGLWLQDLRMLIDAYKIERSILVNLFKLPTEVRRPPPWKGVEKNFFIFWDGNGKQYVHHELYPKRVFAQIDFDGSVGEDAAVEAARKDQICMAQHMPRIRSDKEVIQQATNALMITLCKRKDPGCVPTDDNTFIMHIFHHKTDYDGHTVHEPYVILFRRSAPFAIHAISQRPFWIHGREMLTEESLSRQYQLGAPIPEGHTERFYVVSMSWRTHGHKYHGYLDDVLFISFGIEDSRSGAIDVRASELLQDMASC